MCSAPIFCVLHALIISQSLALRKPSVLLCAKVDDHSSPGLKASGFSGHANKFTQEQVLKKTLEPEMYLTTDQQTLWLEQFWNYDDTRSTPIIQWECACAELAWTFVREKYKTLPIFINKNLSEY